MKKTNQDLNLPNSNRPTPYSETQEALAKAWERKEKMLGKFRADRAKGGM